MLSETAYNCRHSEVGQQTEVMKVSGTCGFKTDNLIGLMVQTAWSTAAVHSVDPDPPYSLRWNLYQSFSYVTKKKLE